jgi:hypothetical protein
VLAEHATGRQRTHIAARVDALIADLIDRESIIDTLVEELRRGAGRGSTTDVDAAYEDDRATRWTNAVQARIEADFEPDEDAITERGTALIAEELGTSAVVRTALALT